MTRSPYELTTPSAVLARLHPRLRTYFGAVPVGHVGRGEGVFAVVGTPRRWIGTAPCGSGSPSRENRPRAPGGTGLRAHRTFRFRTGPRTMVDAITAEPHGLVDHLGRRGRVSALLRAEVDADGPDAGALRLVSTRVTVRVLGRARSLPAVAAPRVTLVERFDDDADVQRVSLRLSAPLIGTLYRYEGAFRYRIEPDTGQGTP